MLHQPRSPTQHSALYTLWQSLLLELSWAIHCLVTSAKRILQKKACFYAQPTMIIPLYPDLSMQYKMNRKHNRRKEQSSICCGSLSSCLSFTSHSPPWKAGLDGNSYSLIPLWLPLSSKDIGWSPWSAAPQVQLTIVWWIQLSTFRKTTMLMLTDFVPEVHNLAFFFLHFLGCQNSKIVSWQ